MRQYCRYCAWCDFISDWENVPYCTALQKEITIAKAKRMNRCRQFAFAGVPRYLQDALKTNLKGYRPRSKPTDIFAKEMWEK